MSSSSFDAVFEFPFETIDLPARTVTTPTIDFSRMDLTLGERSETSKRWNFVIGDDGDVSFDETQAHAVMTSIMERKNGYWADRNHGSDLFELKNLTRRTPSQAEAMMLAAIAPLEQDNSIEATAVRAVTNRQTGSLIADVDWTTPTGAKASQTVEL